MIVCSHLSQASLTGGWAAGQGRQFHIADVEVVTATVNLDEVLSYRGAISSVQEQASAAPRYPSVRVDFDLCHDEDVAARLLPTAPMTAPRYHSPEEEIGLGATLLYTYCQSHDMQSSLG